MTTDDPTTRPAAGGPDRAQPPRPPDRPARPGAAGVPVDATHTEAPPFGTVPVDPVHAEAVRLGAAPPAPPAPPAGTTHTNGTSTHVTPSAAPANGTHLNGTYTNGTYTNGTPASAPPPGADGTAVHPTAPAAPGAPTAPVGTVYRDTAYREPGHPEPGYGDAPVHRDEPARREEPAYHDVPAVEPPAAETAPGEAAPADGGWSAERPADGPGAAYGDVPTLGATPPGTAPDGTATDDGVPAESATAGSAPHDGDPAPAADTALVDAVLGESAGAGADDEDSDERIRTLIWTAATYRPLEEVAALVTQLKNTNAVDSPADEALRAAAVARPLDEVRQLVAMLNAAGHTLDDSDTTLRAAAVGRPIEDVVQLVSILGAADAEPPVLTPGATPDGAPDAAPAGTTGASPSTPLPTVPENPHVRPPRSVSAAAAPVQETKVLDRGPATDGETTAPSRSALRWPAAAALFACGLIHLPTDLAGLRSGGYADTLALVVTVLCLVLGEWLIVRDSARVWGFAAATSVGVVALHGIAGSSGFGLLDSSLGRSWAWSGAAAVTCAMLTALLAGSALLRRQREPDATNGT
ncbi:hypothetical protein ACPCAC_07560 [Streptomyces lavendulocolor]|uniref:hypothetical protein n=1 Tax=Streptomyces lavendulocolor TaxID=67316 RepID=UPI003C303FC8